METLTLALVYALAFGTYLVSLLHLPGRLTPRHYLLLALPPCIAFLLVCAWILLRYGISPLYLDHLEPTVAALSYATFWNGQSLYHGNQFAGLYELPYGPALFLINAVPYLFASPTIQLSKLPGILALCISLVLLSLVIWRRWRRIDLTIASLLSFTAVLMANYQPNFWNRPEPFLVCCACLGLWGSQLRNRWLAVVALAIATAVAVNLKPHAVFYLLPAAYLFARTQGWRALVSCATLSLLLATLPWLLPTISLGNYLWTLRQTAHHPLLKYMFVQNLQLLLALGMPATLLALLHYTRHGAEGKRQLLICLILFVCALPVAVVASKAGAGKHHLLPFAPFWILLTVHAWTSNQVGSLLGQHAKAAILAFVALSVGNATAIQLEVLGEEFLEAEAHQKAAEKELQAVINHYRGQTLEMGVAGTPTYKYSYLRPQLVYAGMPYHIDTASLMDIEYSGIKASSRLHIAMTHCQIPRWVVPRSKVEAPFSINNFYYDDQSLENHTTGNKQLFDQQFLQDFRQHYLLEWSGQIFDVYRCRA